MPIVINEIEIAIEVTPSNAANASASNLSAIQKEEIVKECVEKVMEILQLKTER